MTVYTLHCTLCKADYSKISDWNEHLVNSSHQQFARHEFCQWDKSVRKSCVIIYSRMDLSKHFVKSVVPYLMESLANAISVTITDLILSPRERAGVGIIQFENREKVDQLFSIMKSSSIKIDNQLYQFRQLGKLLKLEWEELLVSTFSIELPTNITNQEEDNSTTAANYPNPEKGTVSSQLKSLLGQMEIPDKEFNTVESVIQEIKQILDETISSPCTIALYKYNYLKLRNRPSCHKYLLYLYISNQESCGYTVLGPENEKRLFQQIESKRTNPSSKSILQKFDTKSDSPSFPKISHTDHSFDPNKVIFFHRRLEIQFKLVTYPTLMAAQQLSRLVEYYCKFDTRVKPLLALVYYWAKVNEMQLSSQDVYDRESYSRQSGHVTLEWLLLTFLFHKEQMLPVPRQILERSHQTIHFANAGKPDLGFKEDIEFAHNWQKTRKPSCETLDSESWSVNLLTLFKMFLEFCLKSLGRGKHIINVRDGEILSSENFCKKFILYSPENRVATSHKFGDHLTQPERDYVFKSTRSMAQNTIMICSLFEITWKLRIDSDNWFKVVYPIIQKTGDKLNKFLNNYTSNICIVESLEYVFLCKK